MLLNEVVAMRSDPRNEYPSLLLITKILHLYCFQQHECEICICIGLTIGATAEDGAHIERATNLRHSETVAHEVDGVYAIRAKGGDVVHHAR